MKIQHLKKTVKLRIDRHIYYCYSKRKRQHAQLLPPRVSRRPSKQNTLLRFLENMKLDLKRQTNANCSQIVSQMFL